MATGSELILGVVGEEQVNALAKKLKVEVDWEERGDQAFEAFQSPLKKAHAKALKRMGFTKIKAASKNHYEAYNTPKGPRDFVPFRLELFYDPSEMGEEREQAFFGIAISGRYFPTFADWDSEHGTLYPVVFDKTLEKVQTIAKEEILRIVPELADAVWIVKERFY